MVIESKRGKTSVLNTFSECSSVKVGGEGVDGGWMPLPTHPQQYCDPASLVLSFSLSLSLSLPLGIYDFFPTARAAFIGKGDVSSM